MTLTYQVLRGKAVVQVLDDLARLRIDVFREWPYLYDGDLAYEADYLASYRNVPKAIIVTAWSDGTMVGASSGMPLVDHADDFATPLSQAGYDPANVFYCAESVLLPAFRGRGAGHAFFAQREAHAMAIGLRYAAFARVLRPTDHPAKPTDYRPLDSFWRKRGYGPVKDGVTSFAWRDLGEDTSTAKQLALWIKELQA